MIQSVTIILPDNRRLVFSGPAQISEEEIEHFKTNSKLAIQIGKPFPLPAGCEFGDVFTEPEKK